VIFIIEVIFGCVNTLGLVFDECHATTNNLVISIFIVFCCFLPDFLNSLDEPILISVGIVCNNSHSSVNLNHLFPVRCFARPIKFNTFELIRIAIFSLQLVTSVFVEIADFFYS